MTRATALLLLCVPPTVAAPVPKAVKNRHAADGAWEVVEWHNRGNRVNPAGFVMRWTIDGEKLSVERVSTNPGVVIRPPRNPPTYSLETVDKRDPQAVDYTATYPGGERVVRYQGRLEVDADTLRFCYDADNRGVRPVECKAGEGVVYYEFKRVKAEGK